MLFTGLLKREFGSLIDFDVPDGGLAFWVRFDPSIDAARLAMTAGSHGVKFMPGATYSISGEPTSGVRLGFASLNELELAEAVKRLGASLRSLQA